ncbi:hypothetical protein SISNIDRAFT_481222 [Sistotremastrum niveocremeum HHB9708]|uniref:Uncharacterized protein n=1 Tax=Sistotremastrum niveocremeum HHB9708 TaxID=1314777 RepID=A0A165A527_9AGAM|nr:hypothetical protein SISNIDRAFT_481222 [Sistotremastrum niveocremeum HHB9708]
MDIDDPPGSSEYLPSLLNALEARIKAISPHAELDRTLFETLLLGFVAGNKNILVQTDGLQEVQNVAKYVAQTLVSIFGFATKKTRLRSRAERSDVLNILFQNSHSDAPTPAPSKKVNKGSRMYSTSSSLSLSPLFTFKAVENSKDADGHPEPHTRLFTKTNHPQALVISGLEQSGRSAQEALLEVLTDGQATSAEGAIWTVPEDFILICICPRGDGTERPPIVKSLLDHFALSAFSSCPSPYHSLQRHSEEPILATEDLHNLRVLQSACTMHHSVQLYLRDLITATRHENRVDATFLTVRCSRDFQDLAKAYRVLHGPSTLSHKLNHSQGMFVDPSDVINVYEGVVAHRLRVRDGPWAETLSPLWGTTVQCAEAAVQFAKAPTPRPTVQEILIDISTKV